MFDGLLSLPLYPRLTADQVDAVASTLVDALEGSTR
jgi:dTDP-4-amino-4,6-dideoxygalactose transaminase